MEVLVALLERPGELVTRGNLRRRLWNDGTVTDFDVGLNTAVSRLRQVLNDPPGSPRFIETIPKRGYRFLAPVQRQPSVAVMPFVNQSPDADGDYFVDGLTEELIGALWRIEGIRVAGRATVWRFKNQKYDPQALARELEVDAILEGTVRRVADQIRIHIHLINGQDGFELWSDRYDDELREILAVHDRVTTCVARALKTRLIHTGPVNGTHNPAAYTAYLRGHYLIKRHTPANSKRALEYFEEAISHDPGYALAYHGASLVHILYTLMGEAPPAAAFAKAEGLLDQGLAIQTDSAMLQNTLAMLRMFQWRWQESERAYESAIALEPANPHPHMMYALERSFVGLHDEALREARTALELDPSDPMMNFRVVQCSYYARRYEAAVRCSRTAIELAPDFPYTYLYMAYALLATGEDDEAWSMAQRGRSLGHSQALCEGQFGYVAGVLGRTTEARAVIAELTARRQRSYSPALPIAWTLLGLGDMDACLQWMEIALNEHEPYLASASVFPAYDPLRSHEKFIRLLEQIGPRQTGRSTPMRSGTAIDLK
jgi:TolB-like protein/Tfp pilus assembly protein PilF